MAREAGVSQPGGGQSRLEGGGLVRSSPDVLSFMFERAQELSRSGVVPKSDLDVKREAFELFGQLVGVAERQDREGGRRPRQPLDGVMQGAVAAGHIIAAPRNAMKSRRSMPANMGRTGLSRLKPVCR